MYMYIYIHCCNGDELISEARSLFRGDVGDVVLNCPDFYNIYIL